MALPIISITGNIKKIETRFTQSGKQVTKFQVECSDKDKDGKWTNLYIGAEVWDKSAEFVAKYFLEGAVAIVTGELYTNVYEKQDGSKVYENRLRFAKVQFAPKDKSGNQNQQPQTQTIPQDNISNTQPQQPTQANYQPQTQIPEYDINSSEIPF